MLQLRAPQILGEISYSMYIVHWLLLWVFYDVAVRTMWGRSLYGATGPLQSVLALAGYVATVILVAYVAHRLVEQPGRTLIRKFA
jgi:peptidoglycan/LPS O-acetylase OafA/YrhL